MLDGAAAGAGQARRLGDLSPQRWRSGIAAWLGWTFDGLDMHLYTLVYAQFVAQLLGVLSTRDPSVGLVPRIRHLQQQQHQPGRQVAGRPVLEGRQG